MKGSDKSADQDSQSWVGQATDDTDYGDNQQVNPAISTFLDEDDKALRQTVVEGAGAFVHSSVKLLSDTMRLFVRQTVTNVCVRGFGVFFGSLIVISQILCHHKTIIGAFLAQKLRMSSLLLDHTFVKHNNSIGILDSRKFVSNDNCSPRALQSIKSTLYLFFCFGVQSTGRFVQEKDLGV